jgi:prevent-host-death family protein
MAGRLTAVLAETYSSGAVLGREEVPMEPISTVEARERFADVVNRAAYGRERVILARRGKPLAAVVPIEDVELLERLEDEADLRELADARDDERQHGSVPWDEVKRRNGL